MAGERYDRVDPGLGVFELQPVKPAGVDKSGQANPIRR